jgi:hypothetical protein
MVGLCTGTTSSPARINHSMDWFFVALDLVGWMLRSVYGSGTWLGGLVTRSSALRSDRGRLRVTVFTGIASTGVFNHLVFPCQDRSSDGLVTGPALFFIRSVA